MKPFWRDAPFTEQEKELIQALGRAHHKSVFRENASTAVMMITADAAKDLGKAIAAAILTTGALHAPIEDTIQFLQEPYPAHLVFHILAENRKVPGWGGNFQKDQIDPIWAEVDHLVREFSPELRAKLDAVTGRLAESGKPVLPNPSAYTACVAIILKMPPKLAPYLFIAGRLPGWAEIAAPYL
jgi:citrate synthase